MKIFNVKELYNDVKIDPFNFNPNDPIGVFFLKAYIPVSIRAIMEENSNEVNPYIEVIFTDNSKEKYYFKQVVLNIMIWRILASLKLPILKEDYHEFININEETLSEIHTKIYYKCLLPEIDERKVYGLFHESISVFYNFTHEYCWEYATGLSLVELYDLFSKPDVEEICNIEVENIYDTKLIERTIDRKKEELISCIKTKYPDSCIGPYLLTDTLNTNQVAQLFIAYGPRSDINDKIIGKPILNSTLKGLRSIEEFGVESLSAKKSAISNRSSVSTASYNSRQGHLTTGEIYHIIHTPCGNDETIKVYIKPNKSHRYLGKIIVVNNQDIFLTKDNIDKYVGTVVDMVSAMHCRYPNGICKRCIGQMSDYISSSLHLGLATGTEVFSQIVQNILSTKHMIKTNTIEYQLNETSVKWFTRVGNKFMLKPINPDWKLVIPTHSCEIINYFNISKPTDLIDMIERENDGEKLKEGNLSRLKDIYIVDENDNLIEAMTLDMNPIYPYFSLRFLTYLINNKNNIVVKDGCHIVPLNKWRFTTTIFKVDNITYDMTAYVQSVFKYLNDDLYRYSDAGLALNDFSELIYEKTEVSIFLVEVILRSLMIAGPKDYSFPIRSTGDPVYFGKLRDVISSRALTPKLAFQGLYSSKQSNQYFNKPGVYLNPVPIGLFADFYNL